MGRTSDDVRADEIEFLAPQDGVFGGADPVEFAGFDDGGFTELDDRPPRSGWATGLSVLAVVAIIGVGVVAAAPWDDDSTAAPTPSSVLTPGPATPGAAGGFDVITSDDGGGTGTTTGAASRTGWVVDPLPAGFAITGAWRDTLAGDGVPRLGWGEVWATSDATRITGSWFSITLVPVTLGPFAEDARRVDLGGRMGLLSQDRDGTMRLQAPAGQGTRPQTLTIVSFGRTADELIALATSIGIDDDRPQLVDDRPIYLDPAQIEGYELIASGATEQDLLAAYLHGTSRTSTWYATGDTSPGSPTIEITSAPRDSSLDPVGRVAIGPVRIFPDSASVPAGFDGEDLVLGVWPSGADAEIVARWHVASGGAGAGADVVGAGIDTGIDTTITIRTTIPLGDLLALLPAVRVTTEREWRLVERRAASIAESFEIGGGGRSISVGAGSFADGGAWSVELDPDADMLRIGSGGSGGAVVMGLPAGDDADPLTIWAGVNGTVVVARSIDGGMLRVSTTAGELRAPLEAVTDPSRPDVAGASMAAVGFDAVGAYTVELVADDGFVVASFRSPG